MPEIIVSVMPFGCDLVSIGQTKNVLHLFLCVIQKPETAVHCSEFTAGLHCFIHPVKF